MAVGGVLVHRRQAFQQRNLAAHTAAHRIHQVAPDLAARVGESLWELRALRIQQNARRLAGARREDHHARARVSLLAGRAVDEVHTRGAAVPSECDLVHHCVGRDIEIATRQSRRQMHGDRLVVGAHRAATVARGCPQARCAAAHPLGRELLRGDIPGMQARRIALVIERAGEHRAVAGDHGYPEAPGALLHQPITYQWRGRRQQTAGRGVRCVLEPLVAAIDSDQQLHLVVVRCEILVRDGPVESQAIAAARLEIVGTVAQRDPAPVTGAAAQHATTPPPEAPGRILRGPHVGLPGYLPAAIDGRVVEAEDLVRCRDGAQRGHVRCLEHGGLALGGVLAPRLEHQDLRAVHAEGIRGLAPRGP